MSGMLFLAVAMTFLVGVSAVGFAVRDARCGRVHREATRAWEVTRQSQLGWDGWLWGLPRVERTDSSSTGRASSADRASSAGVPQTPRWGGESGQPGVRR
ncbi:MAG: hypothetical protein GXX79_11680 [Actinomycetales bacterium]|nr:hypothetical protein [Actinomycetales bacterium]